MLSLDDAIFLLIEKNADPFIIQQLVKIPGYDISSPINHDTFLHVASRNKTPDILELLLEITDIDINAPNENGDTALHVAIYHSNIQAINILLCHPDIDITRKNYTGITAFEYAKMIGGKVNDLLENIYKNPIQKPNTITIKGRKYKLVDLD